MEPGQQCPGSFSFWAGSATFTIRNRFYPQQQAIVTHQNGQFPNETYITGLRDNPESTLAVVYDEFRRPLIRTLTGMGAEETDAAAFFQSAVLDASRFARLGAIPPELSFFEFLLQLGIAHYTDWLEENDQPQPDTPPPAGSTILSKLMPDGAALRLTRRRIFAWQCLELVDADCHEAWLHSAPSDPDTPAEGTVTDGCRQQFLRALQQTDTPLDDIPDWALQAVDDPEDYAIWQRTQELEQEWAAAVPAVQESNRIWRWAMAVLLLVAVGYGAYQLIFRPKTAAEVFADNFAPPKSLVEDLDARYGPEMGNDSVTSRPNRCLQLLREADAYYRAKEYQAAMDPLLLIVLDSTSICQSDAWYFLGIVQLQLEDPTTAIQCFAKIEDLNRYGEDLYWYQALAFVQLAKENPLMRDKARRAVERTLGNTRDPQRRAQAETMLNNLSK